MFSHQKKNTCISHVQNPMLQHLHVIYLKTSTIPEDVFHCDYKIPNGSNLHSLQDKNKSRRNINLKKENHFQLLRFQKFDASCGTDYIKR